MSEEIIQRNILNNYINIGEFRYIDLGNTTFNQLIKENIVSNNIDKYIIKNKPDALILEGGDYPSKIIAIAEYKTPDELNTENKKKEAIEQVCKYCYFSEVDFAILTNGQWFELLFVNSVDKKHEFSIIKNKKKFYADYVQLCNKKLILNNIKNDKNNQEILVKALLTINKKNLKLTNDVVSIDPRALAKEIWQSIWLATGDNPKKCLMTFTELFMYKYLSDIGILNENEDGVGISFEDTFSKGKHKCLKYYMNNVRDYIKKIFPKGYDETTIINGLSVKKDNNQDELFYSILNSFKNFGSLCNVTIEFKSNLFEEFLKGSNGIKLMAQFFTPRNIIRAIINMANVSMLSKNQSICDPACGVGGFIIESMISRNINKDFYKNKNFIESNINYYGYDLDKETIVLAKASLTMLLSQKIIEYKEDLESYANFINSVFTSYHRSSIGSLNNIDGKYDLIMSNPPYVRKGVSLYREFIENDIKLNQFYDIHFDSKEGLFVINMIKSLKPGGKAFIILPDGFLHTKSDRALRNFILQETILDAIISLPPRTFYTTTKKTYIVCVTKKQKDEEQVSPVFNYIVTDVGESLDIARVNTSLEDLNNLTLQYKYFMAEKRKYISKQPQILLQNIEYYKNNDVWLTERIISDDVLNILGIKEEDVFTNINDITKNIEYTINDLTSLNNTLNDLEKLNEEYEYKTISLNDKNKDGTPLFKFISNLIGYKQKEYREKQVDKTMGYPLYTAAKYSVVYLPKDHPKKIKVESNSPHISLATDGDGTAGTNILLHNESYFLNSSRLAIKVLDKNIIPEFIYFSLKNIKKKFGFGYTIKCNKSNLEKYIKIDIPIDEKGNFSVPIQKQIIDNMQKKEEILNKMSKYEETFAIIKKFNQYIAIDD